VEYGKVATVTRSQWLLAMAGTMAFPLFYFFLFLWDALTGVFYVWALPVNAAKDGGAPV
jgi:hypothetical protein